MSLHSYLRKFAPYLNQFSSTCSKKTAHDRVMSARRGSASANAAVGGHPSRGRGTDVVPSFGALDRVKSVLEAQVHVLQRPRLEC